MSTQILAASVSLLAVGYEDSNEEPLRVHRSSSSSRIMGHSPQHNCIKICFESNYIVL